MRASKSVIGPGYFVIFDKQSNKQKIYNPVSYMPAGSKFRTDDKAARVTYSHSNT